MESEIIKAIGQLSVEVVAIISLAGSLYFQAKASSSQAKEMKNLTAAINEHVNKGVEHHLKLTEAVSDIKADTSHNIRLTQAHHLWAQQTKNHFEQT